MTTKETITCLLDFCDGDKEKLESLLQAEKKKTKFLESIYMTGEKYALLTQR
jgi:hypothetical protein